MERITACGGEVGRMNVVGGAEVSFISLPTARTFILSGRTVYETLFEQLNSAL